MPLACELKFLIDRDAGRRIRDWVRGRLDPDPHGSGPFGDQYRTTSLYFDTAAFDVYHARGSYARSKMRIRRYGGADAVFLERKLRRATRLSKRRTLVPLADLDRLAGAPDPAWTGLWFHRRVLLRGLVPACQLSYERVARAGMRDTGAIRLTLDDEIRAMPADAVTFNEGTGAPILPDRMVLELKYRIALPAVFKQLVEEFRLEAAPVSKYRLAVRALGLPRDEPVSAPDATYA